MAEKKMKKSERLQAAREKAITIFDAVPEARSNLVASKLSDDFDLFYDEAKQIVRDICYCEAPMDYGI